MPLSFSSGASKSFAFAGGKIIPETLKFPANCLIPYYGSSNNVELYDWTRYTAADGYYILAATDQSEIGTTYTATSGGLSASGYTGSAGAHAGTAVTQNWTSTTGGSTGQSSSTGPTHNHSYYGYGYSSTDTMLNKQNITLLRSIRSTRYLPANALVVKQTAAANSTAFSATGSNYLFGASEDLTYTTGTGYSFGVSITLSSDSGHFHSSGSTAYKPFAVGAYLRNYNMVYGGAHSHTAYGTFSQSVISSKLVNLWKITSASIPETDLIVMYVGSLSALPETWKLCDGLNDTTNLGGYIIGYSDNQWNVTTTSDAAGALSSTDAAYTPHSHLGGYASTANIAGPTAYHGNYGWSHSHTLSGGYSLSSYLPQRIGVAFIQYKG